MVGIALTKPHLLEKGVIIMPAPSYFFATVCATFDIGHAYYGDVEVSQDLFGDYVWNIVGKHLSDSTGESMVMDFARRLYLRDLYLACGCVHKRDRAWAAFDAHYRKLIADLVRFCYRHGTDSEEVADSVLVSLYFNDRSGRQRIASYDGRSSLATWLRVIVTNRAINDRNERRHSTDDEVGDVADSRALTDVEFSLRADRYGRVFSEALAQALRDISDKERLMLLWRYEQNLPLGEIAQLIGIHQSNVTRQLLRVQDAIRSRVIRCLSSDFHMTPSAIDECLTDVVENPQFSIPLMSIIRNGAKPAVRCSEVPILNRRVGQGR
jgi:RNA polymerase sigma-70 factor (ECF subfamily)